VFEGPKGIIKVRQSASALIVNGVEHLAWKQIPVIDLNHYRINALMKNKTFKT